MKITFAQAQAIAEREIRQVIADSPQLSRYEFGEIYLWHEEPPFWTFGAGSEKLMDEGWAPGAIFVSVDKVNGRIWSKEETGTYYEQIAAASKHRQAA
jgi:hypothetical protein